MLLLDFLLQTTTGRSLIDISYSTRHPIVIVSAWCVASGVVGVFAALLQIVQTTPLAALTVAIGWPLVFAKLVELGAAPPRERMTAEVKDR